MLARWPAWVGYATAVWSLVYGLLGLFWTLGGGGFPFPGGFGPGSFGGIGRRGRRGGGGRF